MTISTIVFSSSKDVTSFKHLLSLRIPPSFSVFTGGNFRRPCSLKLNNDGHMFPTPLSFSGDGTGNGNGSGGSCGGDGSENNGNKNGALMVLVLPEEGRSSDSIPEKFLELETSPFSRWLVQFEGVKEHLLADDRLLAKVMMECGVGMLTKTAVESKKRKEIFFKELKSVYPDVGMNISANLMLAYLRDTTPWIYANVLTDTCRDKVARIVATITLINAKKAFQNALGETLGLSPSAGYGFCMAVSSNLRYQLLAGVVERRLRRPLSNKHKQMLSVACYVQVVIENQSDCCIPIKISLHLTGAFRLRNWCVSLMRSQRRYINELRLV